MSLRKADIFLLFTLSAFCLCLLLFIHSSLKKKSGMPVLREGAEMVKMLELTDLCLFTDARYTRHPAMADLHSPFQDHPMSFEHYPSGSLVAPPPHLHHYALDR